VLRQGRPRFASEQAAGATAGAIRRSSLKAGAPRLRAGAGAAKKECLFLTNEAIMLLKTKDRQNERSQTKPIKATKLLKTKENDCEQSHYVVENKGSIRLGD
jgi:hypothetical protein